MLVYCFDGTSRIFVLIRCDVLIKFWFILLALKLPDLLDKNRHELIVRGAGLEITGREWDLPVEFKPPSTIFGLLVAYTRT
jgi:hypothetical protein